MSGWERAQHRYEQQTREWRLTRGEDARQRERLRVQAAAARVELFDVLVADGWRPDPLVVHQIAQDRELLLEERVAELARVQDEPRSAAQAS